MSDTSHTHDEHVIDFGKLRDRELIILTYKKVEELTKTTVQQEARQQATDIAMAVVKTEMRVWAAVVGFASGLGGAIFMLIVAKAFGK